MIRRAVKINATEEQLPDTVWAIEASDTEYPTMASVEIISKIKEINL